MQGPPCNTVARRTFLSVSQGGRKCKCVRARLGRAAGGQRSAARCGGIGRVYGGAHRSAACTELRLLHSTGVCARCVVCQRDGSSRQRGIWEPTAGQRSNWHRCPDHRNDKFCPRACTTEAAEWRARSGCAKTAGALARAMSQWGKLAEAHARSLLSVGWLDLHRDDAASLLPSHSYVLTGECHVCWFDAQ